MFGQVTIYTTTGCPYCLQAKQTLREQGIDFVDISVDKYSNDLREWLKGETKKSSVPQIFFNNTLIGGNDDLEASIKNSIKWSDYMAILEKREELTIWLPSSDAKITDMVKLKFALDDCSELVEKLRNSTLGFHYCLPVSSKRQSFSGSEFVDWYCKAFDSKDEEVALAKGTELVRKLYIFQIGKSSNFEEFHNNSNVFYKLQDFTRTGALNSTRAENWVIEDSQTLAESLRQLILQLYADHISSDGKLVNYKALKDSSSFQEYEKVSRLLQRVKLNSMNEDTRKAFFINIYNALVIHGNVVVGSPTNMVARLRFYGRTKYVIGGMLFSLNDIENGVLRANKKGVLDLRSPFSKSDPRKLVSLSKIDPRIHFALNCGAKSCPPIKTFSSQEIDSELNSATEAYLESDEAIIIDAPTTKSGLVNIKLSSLLKWYSSDFGKSVREVLEWVRDALSDSSKKSQLGEALITGDWKVSYQPYNWDVNSQ